VSTVDEPFWRAAATAVHVTRDSASRTPHFAHACVWRDSHTKQHSPVRSCVLVEMECVSCGIVNKGKVVPPHEDMLRSGGIAPPLLTSALDAVEWSASRPGRFTPR
jgi:hypothetical protein